MVKTIVNQQPFRIKKEVSQDTIGNCIKSDIRQRPDSIKVLLFPLINRELVLWKNYTKK